MNDEIEFVPLWHERPRREGFDIPPFKNHVLRRKCRLYDCAICRLAWPLIEPYREFRECVEFAERYADGKGAKKRLKKYVDALRLQTKPAMNDPNGKNGLWFAVAAVCRTCQPDDTIYHRIVMRADTVLADAMNMTTAQSIEVQRALFYCIFGESPIPVTLDPNWLTSTTVGLANAIYNRRSFHDMPILADALEEAGCEDASVLSHCRASVEHMRGCWVVDMLLGKS